jgi:hypothetical protein
MKNGTIAAIVEAPAAKAGAAAALYRLHRL